MCGQSSSSGGSFISLQDKLLLFVVLSLLRLLSIQKVCLIFSGKKFIRRDFSLYELAKILFNGWTLP